MFGRLDILPIAGKFYLYIPTQTVRVPLPNKCFYQVFDSIEDAHAARKALR